jgi:hypothetical protein
MEEEMARFKVCLIHGIKRGGGGNGRQMQCRARGNGSMVGKAGATLGGGARPAVVALHYFSAEGGRRGRVGRVGQKAEQVDGAAGWSWANKASWAKRLDRLAGLLGRLGQNLKRKPFGKKMDFGIYQGFENLYKEILEEF